MKENILLILKENLRLFIGTIVVLVILIFLITLFLSRQTNPVAEIGNEKFSLKIAKTDKEKQIGLSETEKLDEKEGMLFVFNTPDKYSFWMRGMSFPIDIIYIKNDEVVEVIENAQVPSSADSELKIYQPNTEADKVLEVNSGVAKKYNIKKGSKIEFTNL